MSEERQGKGRAREGREEERTEEEKRCCAWDFCLKACSQLLGPLRGAQELLPYH